MTRPARGRSGTDAGWSRGSACRQTSGSRGMDPRCRPFPGTCPPCGQRISGRSRAAGVRRPSPEDAEHRSSSNHSRLALTSGHHLPMSLRCHSGSPDVPGSDLLDEDPRDTISRLIGVEEERLRVRQADLATARNALVRLHDLGAAPAIPAIAPITVEVAPALLRSLLDQTSPGRCATRSMRMDVGSGTVEDWMSYNLEVVRDGKEQRTLYDDSVLESPVLAAEIAEWAGGRRAPTRAGRGAQRVRHLRRPRRGGSRGLG